MIISNAFAYFVVLFIFYLFNIYTGLPAQAKPVLPQGPVDIHTVTLYKYNIKT